MSDAPPALQHLALPPALAEQARALAEALGESPETVLRLALRVGLDALPARLGLVPSEPPRPDAPKPPSKAPSARPSAESAERPKAKAAPGPKNLSDILAKTPEGAWPFSQPPAPDAAPPRATTTLASFSLLETPTPDDLRALLAVLDDSAGHHILWIDRAAKVHATCLDAGTPPSVWLRDHEREVLFELGTFCTQNGDVGPTAAADDAWVLRLYTDLMRRWTPFAPPRPEDDEP
jgi:hypothetical protein